MSKGIFTAENIDKAKLYATTLAATGAFATELKFATKLGRAVALWALNKFLYPKKILKIMVGKDLPEFTKVMFQSTSVMTHNLAQARLACAKIDVLIQPNLKGLRWSDFDKAEKFIALGEKAMMNKIGEIKKKLR